MTEGVRIPRPLVAVAVYKVDLEGEKKSNDQQQEKNG